MTAHETARRHAKCLRFIEYEYGLSSGSCSRALSMLCLGATKTAWRAYNCDPGRHFDAVFRLPAVRYDGQNGAAAVLTLTLLYQEARNALLKCCIRPLSLRRAVAQVAKASLYIDVPDARSLHVNIFRSPRLHPKMGVFNDL